MSSWNVRAWGIELSNLSDVLTTNDTKENKGPDQPLAFVVSFVVRDFGRLTQPIEHGRRDQFLFDVTLDTLREEFAQVGTSLARPWSAGECLNWRVEHLNCQSTRFGRDF